MSETRPTHREEFWSHLVAANAFDEAIVDELKDAVRRSPWKPLGGILVELGHLRFKQIAYLLRMQADEMHLRIGELAVREGLCSPTRIEEALAAQFERNMTPIEVITDDERVDTNRLISGLNRYIVDLEARLTESMSDAA